MVRCREEPHRVLGEHQRGGLQLGGRPTHDRQVDLVAGQHANDLVAVADLKVELDLRVVVGEGDQQRRQQVFGGGHRADAQRAREDASQRCHLLARLAPQLQDAARVLGQQLARGRRSDSPAGTHQQWRSRGLFEDADLDRHRRLRQVQLVGCERHAVEPRDGVEGRELTEGGVLRERHGGTPGQRAILAIHNGSVKKFHFCKFESCVILRPVPS